MPDQSKLEYIRNKIEVLTEEGKDGQVIKEYDNLISIAGDDHEIRFKKAMLFFKLKKIKRAESECKRAIELNPNMPIYHYARAMALNILGSYHDSLKEVNEVLRLVGSSITGKPSGEPKARNVNSEIDRLLKRFEQLDNDKRVSYVPNTEVSALVPYAEPEPQRSNIHRVLLKEQAMVDVDFTESLDDIKKLDRALKQIDLYYNRVFSATKQSDSGIEDKEEMLRRFMVEDNDPQMTEIFRSFSDVIRVDLSGQEAKSLSRIDRVIDQNPKNAELHYGKALLLYTRGELDDAQREIDIARHLDPLSSAYTFGKTLIENKSLDYEQAIRHLTTLSRETPEDTTVHYKRGLMLYLLKRHGEAIDEFNNAIDLYQFDPRYYFARSLARYSLDVAKQ